MSNVVLINFANERFQAVQELCTKTGRYVGHFSKVISYSPADIDPVFRDKYQEVLSVKRGAGLWLWKPYFIDKTLNQIEDGDYLFYCDSGAFFTRSVRNIIRSMDSDIWVTELPLIEEQWTKPLCFEKMGLESPVYKESNQIQASFLCIRKSDYSMGFVREWLELCCNESLLFPEEGEDQRSSKPRFIAHREDQSLLSLLCKKEGLLPHKDPSQFGRYPEGYRQPKYLFRPNSHSGDKYKTTIILHRLPEIRRKSMLKSYLIGCGPKKISDRLFYGGM